MKMPAEFFGVIRGQRANCGICGMVVSVSPHETRAKQELRDEGWTWRADTGWTCYCRHQCGNLDPSQDPTHPTRPNRRRQRRRSGRYAEPSKRVKKLIRKRNRHEIE